MVLRTCEYCVGRGEKVFGNHDRTDQKHFGHCAKKSVNDGKKKPRPAQLTALINMHRAGQRSFELLALIHSPQLL